MVVTKLNYSPWFTLVIKRIVISLIIKNNKKVVTESNLQSRESQFSGFAIRYKINSELRQGDL